ncbi:hypothetical protein T08_4344 [Trichinella sp. T8]|nr:hypothetical protein T08_4344 [Trichinella sp. T8]
MVTFRKVASITLADCDAESAISKAATPHLLRRIISILLQCALRISPSVGMLSFHRDGSDQENRLSHLLAISFTLAKFPFQLSFPCSQFITKHLERLHVANCPWSSDYKKVLHFRYAKTLQQASFKRSRIIEISKVSVASLTYPKMLEFLNNANTRVLVIPPLNEGSPRRCCEDPHCPSVRGEVTPIIRTVRVPHYGTFPPRYVVVVLRRSYVCLCGCL